MFFGACDFCAAIDDTLLDCRNQQDAHRELINSATTGHVNVQGANRSREAGWVACRQAGWSQRAMEVRERLELVHSPASCILGVAGAFLHPNKWYCA